MTGDRRLRIGVQLSFAGTGGEWAAKARRVEALGYFTLCVPDHFDDQLAVREAEIVSVNFDLSPGAIGTHFGATATAGATAENVGWLREAAGDRFSDVELSHTAYLSTVNDDRDAVAAGPGSGFGLDRDQVLAMPNFVMGTVAQIADELERRRDGLGFSDVVAGGECHEAVAPVVARLAGR
ncbi:MAG TPA: hypothetical protein VMZ73_02620 [Acidimicrobiales bacterium]|nr:hypothetical protein [Acidimicrobiales bacterium]